MHECAAHTPKWVLASSLVLPQYSKEKKYENRRKQGFTQKLNKTKNINIKINVINIGFFYFNWLKK